MKLLKNENKNKKKGIKMDQKLFLQEVFLQMNDAQRKEFLDFAEINKAQPKSFLTPEEFLEGLSSRARAVLYKYMKTNNTHPMYLTSRELKNLENCGLKIQTEIRKHFVCLGVTMQLG